MDNGQLNCIEVNNSFILNLGKDPLVFLVCRHVVLAVLIQEGDVFNLQPMYADTENK